MFGFAGLIFAAAAVRLLGATWQYLVEGEVAVAMASAAGFMIVLSLAVRCALWLTVQAPGPAGIRIPREAAEPLHRLVERMGERFGRVPVDAVWVGGDMNAAILQRPRWGWIGPMETHLIIGLPLAHSVSRRQFGAILAHEFAHLAHQRQRLDAWGAHVRAWWFRVMDRCIEASPRFGRGLERWCAGDLRDALRLARLEEFQADALAAGAVGARLVGETLVEIALKERFLSEDYWCKVMAQSRNQPQPSIRPYREMGHGMMAGFRRPLPGLFDLRGWVGNGDSASSVGSFHPTIAERLRALGVRPQVPHGAPLSFADAYLGPLLPTLAWVFDRAWWLDSRVAWRRCYQLSQLV